MRAPKHKEDTVDQWQKKKIDTGAINHRMKIHSILSKIRLNENPVIFN